MVQDVLIDVCERMLCRYWFRHAALAWVELPIYAVSCRRYKLAAQVVAAEVLYGLYVYAMYQWKPVATLWLFTIPYVLSTLAMMFGNWYVSINMSQRTVCAVSAVRVHMT